MITVLTALYVLLSLTLIIVIPVTIATPGEWESSKDNINKLFRAWVVLLIAIAIADGVTSSI